MHAKYANDTLTTLESDMQHPHVAIRFREGGKEKVVWAGQPVCGTRVAQVYTKAYLAIRTCHCSICAPHGKRPEFTEIPLRDLVEVEVKELREYISPFEADSRDYFPFARWLLNRYDKLKRLALNE